MLTEPPVSSKISPDKQENRVPTALEPDVPASPERIHHLAFTAMKLVTRFAPIRWLVAKVLVLDDPVLRSQAFGLTFPAPLGLAAGFDKDATGVDAWGPLGFGFAEIGTVTAQAQPGNPQPRLFRLPADRALINRMGFNNHGAGHAANFLRQRRVIVPIGANIGKTKIVDAADAPADYTASAQLLGPLADFMVVNVSSPNTPGLRDLQAVESLRPLLQAVLDTVHIPVLVKIALICPTRTSTQSPISLSNSGWPASWPRTPPFAVTV